MPFLDTNFLIDLLRGDPDARKKMSDLDDGRTGIAASAVTVCELYKGALKSERSKENAAAVERLLENVVIYVFDSAARVSAGIMDELRKKGQTVSAMDVLIAGTAIANNESLLTRDIELYKRITRLRVETW